MLGFLRFRRICTLNDLSGNGNLQQDPLLGKFTIKTFCRLLELYNI